MPSFAIMTNTGRNKEAAALANGTGLDITHIAWGDGDRSPSGGETALLNEQGRKPVQGTGTVDGALNTAFFSILLTEAEGPYVVREAGLFDGDGDLIAIARYDPEVNKPVDTVSALIRVNVVFSDLENLILRVQSTDAFVPAERILTAGNGLTGGGDLSNDRRFDLNFATDQIALNGVNTSRPMTPANLLHVMGQRPDRLPLGLALSNGGQTDQSIPPNVATRCNNMVAGLNTLAPRWNGFRFTVTSEDLGLYGVLNRLNTNSETGEGAQTWKNGTLLERYQLSDTAGAGNVVGFTHFTELLTPGDHLEFYHFHLSATAKLNQASSVQIYRLQPYVLT